MFEGIEIDRQSACAFFLALLNANLGTQLLRELPFKIGGVRGACPLGLCGPFVAGWAGGFKDLANRLLNLPDGPSLLDGPDRQRSLGIAIGHARQHFGVPPCQQAIANKLLNITL